MVFRFSLLAQTDSAYNFVIPQFRIHQTENNKKVFYEFENNMNFVSVNDSFFIVEPRLYVYKVRISDISRIGVYSKNYGSSLIPIMGGIGFAVGFIVGGININFGGGSGDFDHGKALVGGLITGGACAFIGAGISLIAGGYDYNEIDKRNFKQKRLQLLHALKKHKLKL